MWEDKEVVATGLPSGGIKSESRYLTLEESAQELRMGGWDLLNSFFKPLKS